MQKQNVTVFHNNSIAEDVVFYQGGEPVSALLGISIGRFAASSLGLEGNSLIHSAELTSKTISFTCFTPLRVIFLMMDILTVCI